MNDMTTKPTSKPLARSIFPEVAGPVGWLRNEIDRLFDDFGKPARSALNFALRETAPVPALEMTEGDKDYRLTAELPGLEDKDVEIEVADGMISISGEKKEEQEHRENGRVVSERRYGAFERRVSLPADVDPERIKASFNNGVLTVTLAKDQKAAARTRKIAIEKH